MIAERRELCPLGVGQQIRTGCRQLPGLDECGPQPFEGSAEALRAVRHRWLHRMGDATAQR